jgi:hypothetical protein
VYDVLVIRRCTSQHTAVIAGTELTQRKISRIEVIYAVRANQIEFDFVQRSGAGGGAEVDFSTGPCLFLGYARGEMEYSSELSSAVDGYRLGRFG